jgi:hypothetical protein
LASSPNAFYLEYTMSDLVEMALPNHPDSQRMWNLWLAYWARAAHEPRLAAIHSERYRVWRGAVERVIADGVESREFARVDAKNIAREIVALIDGVAIEMMIGDEEMSGEHARQILGQFIELRVPAP